jgi:hypothetical protein
MADGGLIAELCRLFNAKPVAIECLMRHGQLTVDGYLMRPEFDQRWKRAQLQGRTAAINYRLGAKRGGRLYE